MEVDVPQMKSFVVKNLKGVRSGILQSNSHAITTPACVVHTKFGVPAYLTVDLLDKMKAQYALHVPIQDLAEIVPNIVKSGGGYKAFSNTQKELSIFSCRDPSNYMESNQGSLQIQVKSGRQLVSVKGCHEILAATQPDFAVAMTYDMPWQHTRKRIKKQVDVTLAWLDELLACDATYKDYLFGAIQGGGNEEERIRSAIQTNERGVFGFMLSSFHMDEEEEESRKMISTVISNIDEGKPRMINTKGDPLSILRDISFGIDLFCTSFLDTVTNLGCALTWNLYSNNNHQRQNSDEVMISLREQQYITDPSPLVSGCQCFACTHHSKAYIYHLLNTHEMLGVTLLQIHNMHHYTLFFEQIQNSIKDGYFEEYKKGFIDTVTK